MFEHKKALYIDKNVLPFGVERFNNLFTFLQCFVKRLSIKHDTTNFIKTSKCISKNFLRFSILLFFCLVLLQTFNTQDRFKIFEIFVDIYATTCFNIYENSQNFSSAFKNHFALSVTISKSLTCSYKSKSPFYILFKFFLLKNFG